MSRRWGYKSESQGKRGKRLDKMDVEVMERRSTESSQDEVLRVVSREMEQILPFSSKSDAFMV